MANLSRARNRFIAGVVALATISIIATAYLLLPLGDSNRDLEDRLQQARQEVETMRKEITPVKDIGKKLATSRSDIDSFYKNRLPANYSTISAELRKLQVTNNVSIPTLPYNAKPTEFPELQQVQITTDLSGEYLRLAKFINALERDKLFFIIDSVNLSETKEQGKEQGSVKLQMHIETYLRNQS